MKLQNWQQNLDTKQCMLHRLNYHRRVDEWHIYTTVCGTLVYGYHY